MTLFMSAVPITTDFESGGRSYGYSESSPTKTISPVHPTRRSVKAAARPAMPEPAISAIVIEPT